MTENFPPPNHETCSSPGASPRWLRRLDTSPSVIDAAAAQRVYARTAGWAMQRIARASDLATRHASSDQGGAAGELLLARKSVGVAPAQGEASLADSAAVVSVRRADRGGPWRDASSNHKTAHDAALSASSTAAPSALTVRLQRRSAGPGVVKIQAPQALDRAVPGVSLRSGLHERLAARAGLAPQPMPAAVRLARGADQPAHGNEAERADPIAARAAQAGETVNRLARTGADAAPAASLMPLGDRAPANPSTALERTVGEVAAPLVPPAIATPDAPSAPQAAPVAVSPITASTVARKPIDAPAHATPAPPTLARTSEIAPVASSPDGADVTLRLAGGSVGTSFSAVMPPATAAPADTKPESATPRSNSAVLTPPLLPTGGANRASTASTVARKSDAVSIDMPRHSTTVESLPRATEIAPATSASLATETTLHLAGATPGSAQPVSPPRLPAPNTNATAADFQPRHNRAVPASATESAHAAFPIVAPDVVAIPSAVSVVHPVVHRVSGSPLSLARAPDYRATYASGESATHDAAPAHAKHRSSVQKGGAIARVAEIPAAASHADPTLVWRAANETGARAWPARSRDAGSNGVLMRAGTEDVTDAGSAAAPSAPASVPPATGASAATPAAPAPRLDMNRLAEQVTRLIVRRLEVERERRWGRK